MKPERRNTKKNAYESLVVEGKHCHNLMMVGQKRTKAKSCSFPSLDFAFLSFCPIGRYGGVAKG